MARRRAPPRGPKARRYGTFGTTADVGIWAAAARPDDLFDALGLALFSVMTDLRKVRAVEERAVDASAEDPAGLAVAFLNALVLLADDGFLVREVRARVVGEPPTSVLAAVSGERFDPARHAVKTEVKAVTLHGLSVDLARGRARVILDI